MRRRGAGKAGVVRDPGGLGLIADRGPGAACRLRVVVVAARVPGSCDERGDRQREGVDDNESRVGPARHGEVRGFTGALAGLSGGWDAGQPSGLL